MTHIDHHSKPYDEGTLNKLEIFSRYVEAWYLHLLCNHILKK